MTAQDLANLSIAELSGFLERRELSPVEVTKAALQRAEALNPQLNAFISVQAEAALSAARQAEEEIGNGRYCGPLHGIPMAVKDLYYTAGITTTCGSAAFADFVPDVDATVVTRLRGAGAVLLGKLNMNEIALGTTGLNKHFGAARNPWNTDHMPGGSSSGSGVAVAAGMVYGAVGSDTGGSIRIPSALCGITGLKPTYGLVSLQGALPLSWSLDHGGPMARTTEDCALLLQAMAAFDPGYDASIRGPDVDYKQSLRTDLKGVRLGVVDDPLFQQADEEVLAAFKGALRVMEGLGATVEEVSIPYLRHGPDIGPTILTAEAAAYHAPFLRERSHLYDPEVLARLESGFAIPATAYVHAQRVRRILEQQMTDALQNVEAIVAPTTQVPAPPLDGRVVTIGGKEQDSRRFLANLMRPFNLTGQPALAVPSGFSSEGLPLSIQIAGRYLEDASVLAIGHAYQSATDWHKRRPVL
ncbi:MAG: aspartyl-tRNA(Asn)/glutamyl-tRNA(Gln) amidotransferase subunit A [Chloroflexi bacterium]|jgi:aspartyl-tRNA(Asn)/glutamyl-tRNA(Gln) amidotransferase subunit A|nr:MAG: aspartyl-tRNA(Asn)/glutamyl-tRNA(Gln) amidotransferase subunit A [Chloroflexota bacterium]